MLQNNALGLSSDTVIFDIATLDINRSSKFRSNPPDARHPEFEGVITYKDKVYPVQFYLIPAARVTTGVGPHAFFLFEYNFPVGMHIPDTEEIFLVDLGLINDNFSLQLMPSKRSMIWKGLNRGINRITLKKM